MARGPSQRQRIFEVLEAKGYVANQDFQDMGLLHIGRNRITDAYARAYFAERGLKVVYHHADNFLEHRWVLEAIEEPPVFDAAGQAQLGLR